MTRTAVTNKELDALEKDIQSLRDVKDREEALRALSQLRSLRDSHDQEGAKAARKASHGPTRESISLLKSIELLHRLKSDNVDTKNSAIAEIRQRREREDQLIKQTAKTLRNPVYRNQVRDRFRVRKRLFRFTGVMLVATVFLVAANARSWGWSHEGTILALVIGFGLTYWYAANRLWRCPACNLKLPFVSNLDRSNIKQCRRCGALLA